MTSRRSILVAATLCGCGDGGGETGIDLAIRYQADLGLDRFALTASAGSESLVDRTLLPEEDRPISDSGREDVIVLVPRDVAGGEVTLRVEGLFRGDVIASGQVTVRVAPGELVPAGVTLRVRDAECAEWEWAPSNVAPCDDGAPPDGPLVLDGPGTYTLDTETGRVATPDGDPLVPASMLVAQPGGPMVRLVSVDGLVVEEDAVLEVIGPQPLVVAVWGEATIAGAIEVLAGGGRPDDCIAAGAGGNAADASSAAGGGGGGAFAGDGGDGGEGDGGDKGEKGKKGRIAGEPSLSPLRGGCPGAPGGDAFGDAGSGGAGGRGGGAIQIAARDAVLLSGVLGAAGEGGAGGAPAAGGGGGGSGGAILIESPDIRFAGGSSLCANGASGGEGGGAEEEGAGGAPGTCSGERAATANQQPGGGDGGRGSAGHDVGGENGKNGGDSGAGGGGGGGIGRIRLRALDDLTDLGALVTPAAG